mmetsp:Transcript_18701/g.58744  ORF Transcript_18701/g.58744 Transcript_18701/m.58744 type:complete len:114 (+) Transcript_18701:67-408(+)
MAAPGETSSVTGIEPVFVCRRYVCFGADSEARTMSIFSYDMQPQSLLLRLATDSADEFRTAVDAVKETMQGWGGTGKGDWFCGNYMFLTCPDSTSRRRSRSWWPRSGRCARRR